MAELHESSSNDSLPPKHSPRMIENSSNPPVATLHGVDVSKLTPEQVAILNRKPTTAEFHVLEEVGSGSYSEVNLVRDLKTRQLRAMKVVSARTLTKERKTGQAKREKETLIACQKCQYIINLYNTFFDQQMQTLNFVIPFIENGNLQVVLKHTGSSLSLASTQHVMYQLVQAVNFMHDLGILNRDLKPENMLFDNHLILKMCDFGTSIDTKIEQPKTFLGSAFYVSPEVITSKKATKASDYWAVGCILYEVLMGGKMFKGLGEYHVMQKIDKLEFNTLPENLPYRELIIGMCAKEEATRVESYQKFSDSFKDYKLNEENFKFTAYSPLDDRDSSTVEPFVYQHFKDILNVPDLLTDKTDEVERNDDDINYVDYDNFKKNVEPSQGAKYFGENLMGWFNGTVHERAGEYEKLLSGWGGEGFRGFWERILVQRTLFFDQKIDPKISLFIEQYRYNKWSAFLNQDEIIILQGEMFVRNGYERQVLETNKDPPAEPQMFLLVVNSKTSQKYILGPGVVKLDKKMLAL